MFIIYKHVEVYRGYRPQINLHWFTLRIPSSIVNVFRHVTMASDFIV